MSGINNIGDKKNKVLQLITGLNTGGAEKVVFDLSKGLMEKSYEVVVIGISEMDFLLPMFINEGIDTKVLRVNKKFSSFVLGIKQLKKIIKDRQIKIIHAHMVHALLMALCVKLFMPSIKIVFTPHSVNLESRFRTILVCLLRPFRAFDIVFSEKMKNNIYKNNTVVIPNGIKTSHYNLEVEKNKIFTFVCIGRIEYVKNFISLVDVAEKLKGVFEFEIHIVGEGILKEEMISKIEKKKLTSIFKFLGYRKDINLICNTSHVFLLPSLWEGMPISLLEAGASSLPIITTPVGSIPELIDEKSGYICDIDSFEKVMKEVYYNYSEATKKGNLLREIIVANYDINAVVERHITIYEQL